MFTHQLGGGAPDIVLGSDGLTFTGMFDKELVRRLLESVANVEIHDGANLMVEIKDGSLSPSKRKLTDDEEEFHEKWCGQIVICENRQDILDILGR